MRSTWAYLVTLVEVSMTLWRILNYHPAMLQRVVCNHRAWLHGVNNWETLTCGPLVRSPRNAASQW